MSNTSRHPIETPSKASFLDTFEEGAFSEYLQKYGKPALYVVAGLLATLAIVFAFISKRDGKAETNYLQAASDFTAFTKYAPQEGAKSEDALLSLQALMAKYPELHAAYDGAIGQTLLNRHQVGEATPYINATLARTASDDLVYYNEFSAITLLISNQNYVKGLEKSLALQQKMRDAVRLNADEYQRAFGDELFAFNLLRIAMLQQQTNDAAGELQTWHEWKQYTGLDKAASATDIKVRPQAFRSIIQQLAIGSVALPDYISYREAILKK